MIRAQKILLLAWEFEENLLEIKTAETALAGQDRRLLASLHGPEDGGASPAEAPAAPTPLAWPALLEAAAACLPAEALLITASPELGAALDALSPLADLPVELAEALAETPEFTPLLAQLRFARVRLGDLLGGRGKTAARPWLKRIYNFAVLTR